MLHHHDLKRSTAALFAAFCLLVIVACGTTTPKNNDETGGDGGGTGTAADFALSVSPIKLSLTAGTAQGVSVSVTGTNGFSGTVNVALSGLPDGVTASPAALNLTPGTPQNVTLTAAPSATTTSAMATFTGTAGELTHAATLALDLTAPPPPPPADFALSIAPTSLSLTAGGQGQQVAVSATAENGFTGTVDVTWSGLPTGVTASPATLSLIPGTPQNVTFTAAAGAQVGSVNATVTGTSGSLTHSSPLSLQIAAATPPPLAGDFTLSVTPASLALTAGAPGQPITVTATPQNGFTGPVSVALAGLPVGVTATPAVLSLTPGAPQNITLVAAANAATGNAALTLTGTSGSLEHAVTLALNVAPPPPPADFTLTASPLSVALAAGSAGQPVTLTATAGNGFSSTVNITVSGLPSGVVASPAMLSLTPGVPQNITLAAAINAAVGKTTVTFTGASGSLMHTTTTALTVTGPPPPGDFTLSVFPGSLSLTAGAQGQPIAVSVAAVNVFTDPVTVILSGLPAGVTASPSTLTMVPGIAQSIILTAASNATVGNATIAFTGTAGSLSHKATAALTVAAPTPAPDFTLSVAPGSLSLVAGQPGQPISVSATAQNGFSGAVNLALSGLPSGVTASPSTLSLTPGIAQTITLTAASNATVGNATLTYTGTSGSLLHSTTSALTVTAQPNFTLALSPANLSLTAGKPGLPIAINTNAQNGFTGTVNVTVSGLPAGVTASPTTLALTPGTPQSITLTAVSNATPGNATITFTGTSGSLTHTATAGLTVAPAPDFTLAVSPGDLSIAPGKPGQPIAVSATALNGFTGPINVILSGLSAGVTASSTTLALTPGTPQSITLTAASNATIGNATVTFTGTSGSLTHSATTALTVTAAPDFTLSASPGSLSLTAGKPGQAISVNATALNNFTGTINVTLSGLPTGVTASPTTLALTPGTPQSITLTAASNATIGNATVTLTGSSGSLTHTTTTALAVAAAPDFTLSASPGSLSLTAGKPGQAISVNATALNNFTGTVNVTLSGLPTGVTASPTTLALTPGTPQNITLTAASNATIGNATVTLTGRSGSLTHTTTTALAVAAAPDFTLSASPGSLSLTAGKPGQAISVNATALNNFTGTVNVTLSGLPTGVTASPTTLTLTPGTPQNITLTAASNATIGNATVTLTGRSGTLSHTATTALTVTAAPDFTLSVSPGSLSLTAGKPGQAISVSATALNNFTGPVNVTLSGLPAGVTASPATLTLTPGTPQSITLTAASNSTIGNATVTLTGTSGSLTRSATTALTVAAAPDFTLSASPGSLSLTAGKPGQAISVNATALNNFTGTINVTLSGLPTGVTASPTTLALTPGTPQSITLTAASNATIGNATVTLTGSSGSLTHTTTTALAVAAAPDFTLSASPGSLSLTAGKPGQAISISATALNNFSGTVNVTISGLPTGVTASPTTLTLTPGTPQSITLTAASNATIGNTTLSLTGSSGSLTHSATTALTVTAAPDFTLSVSPGSLSLTAGKPGQAISISATALNNFTGTINVTLSGLPTGVTASPATLALTPGTPQNITLTAASNATIGNATVTLTGASGSLTHTATLALSVAAAPPPTGSIDVTTYHNDNARDGLNANETTLTLTNVNANTFGKLGFYPVDGKVDGEPLYLSSLQIGGATHNVLYVVTEHDSIYAFDADTGSILWHKSALGTGENPSDDHGCGQITPEIGITATPVIDRNAGTNGTIFVVAMTLDATGAYHQRLHALDITTGAELANGPTEITATYPGTGAFSQGGVQTFVPGLHTERVGLLLMNGSIFMGWTSHCDQGNYTGWVMMYNEQTLQQTTVFNLTPNGTIGNGAIWQSGAGLAGDASGNLYFLDANGDFDTTLDTNGFPVQGDYGNSFMKFSTANNKLTPADYFNPDNTVYETSNDIDLGAGGALLLPDMKNSKGTTVQLALGAGKDGNIYVVDRNNMGKFNSSANNIYQQITEAFSGSGIWSMPAYFNNTVYYGSVNNSMTAFTIQAGTLTLSTSPTSQTSTVFPYPGATPSVSANGTQNGIVWALESGEGQTAVLHAYDASNLNHELYNSNQADGGRDQFGNGNKFITPMIVNGKVFVAAPNGVAVFGLLK